MQGAPAGERRLLLGSLSPSPLWCANQSARRLGLARPPRYCCGTSVLAKGHAWWANSPRRNLACEPGGAGGQGLLKTSQRGAAMSADTNCEPRLRAPAAHRGSTFPHLLYMFQRVGCGFSATQPWPRPVGGTTRSYDRREAAALEGMGARNGTVVCGLIAGGSAVYLISGYRHEAQTKPPAPMNGSPSGISLTSGNAKHTCCSKQPP